MAEEGPRVGRSPKHLFVILLRASPCPTEEMERAWPQAEESIPVVCDPGISAFRVLFFLLCSNPESKLGTEFFHLGTSGA